MSATSVDGLTVVPLGSGSKGNSTWIGDERRGVLIDCGISTKQIRTRLEAVGMADAPIDAVLLTHEHTDHVGSCAVLDRWLRKHRGAEVPFYCTAGTLSGMPDRIRPEALRLVEAGARIEVSGLSLEAHAVPHDTRAPIAWAVESEGTRAGVITDLGHATKLVARLLSTLDAAVVEFNHDDQMLLDGSYPWPLKQRIRGRHGHLSNRQAARLVREGASARLRHLVLAHLSDENNTPEHALRAAEVGLVDAEASDVVVHLAEQARAVDPIRVSGRSWALGGLAEASSQTSLF